MPRIKHTRTVSIALILLRVYLLGMLLIILWKFILEARGKTGREASPPATAAGDSAPPTGVVPMLLHASFRPHPACRMGNEVEWLK